MNPTKAPGEGRAEAALFSHSKYSLASLLIVERLYRIRHVHRGTHPARSVEELCRLLWLGLSRSRQQLNSVFSAARKPQ